MEIHQVSHLPPQIHAPEKEAVEEGFRFTEVGVNMNNFDQHLIQNMPVRIFDGAKTWAYLD